MAESIIFYDEKKIFFFDGKSDSELIEPLQIDSFNKFVSSRLLNLIQSNIIDKGLEIKAVISDSRDVFLIPDELYNSSKREEFYKLNYSNIPAGKIIKEQSISLLNATLIYSCKKWFHDFFEHHFQETPIFNRSALHLKKTLSHREVIRDIHIIIKNDTFDIIKIKNKNLHSFNSIDYTSMNDIIYFLIGHIEKLNIENPSISVFGKMTQLEEIKKITSKMDSLKNNDYHFNSNLNYLELIT